MIYFLLRKFGQTHTHTDIDIKAMRSLLELHAHPNEPLNVLCKDDLRESW